MDIKKQAAKVGMGESDEGVVFSGTGEPLNAIETILEAASLIKETRHGLPLKLHTTGLFNSNEASIDVSEVSLKLMENGIEFVTWFLPSADPREYPFLNQACKEGCFFKFKTIIDKLN